MRQARSRRFLVPALAASGIGLLGILGPAPVQAAECARLTQLVLPDMKVLSASEVQAGPFTPAGPGSRPVTVAAFCRVQAEATPAPDSRIGLEIWLPAASAWNGKLLGIGNGGYSSVLDYPAMADGLSRGYAAVATDQGHQGEDLRFVTGHPGKIEDWADRAIHVMTEGAKAIVRDGLGRWPSRAYFAGCSTGGFQGMAETQRHPADYDGVIAGAPGYPRLNLSASFLAAWIANHDEQGREILPRAKLALLNRSAVAACDDLDGVRDGVIGDPRACRFDPAALLCKAGDAEDCLTQPQAEAARKVYAGPRNAAGEPIFPGWDPGSEAPGGDPSLGWTAYIVGQPEPVRLELWKYWLFGDPSFDWHSFDFDRDLAAASERLPLMNAVSPHLDAFRARGGKLLMYFGWADNVSSARTGIDYYDSVERTVGDRGRMQDFLRLFLAPGMAHCSGGPGPDRFDTIAALEDWVERGKAPDRLTASHGIGGQVDRTRPLCPYPMAARYAGTGSTNEAANFTCVPSTLAVEPDAGAWLRRLQEGYGR